MASFPRRTHSVLLAQKPALAFPFRPMALIRVTSCKVEDNTQHEIILNTAHIVTVSSDSHKPARGSWVQLVTGEPVLVCLSFEEMWTLIQRET
jgi:hypothetical protein